MADVDDLFTPPNGAAYETEERRKGPSLTYVGEKSRAALYHLHALCRELRETPSRSPTGAGIHDGQPIADGMAELAGRAEATFYFALVSFLALYNSLGRLGEWEQQDKKVRALLQLSREAFDEWLDSIEAEGSVTG